MAVNLSPIGGVAGQFFDNNGDPLTGGKIYTYAAGTTTPLQTYTSSTGGTPHTNPIILDAAGRVPGGEIWLTDGAQYKFVIKTSVDVQIGSYDNIIGINSNFVNYTNSQEIQTATAGQTVFTLTTMQYQPATNSLSVFVDGVNQYGPGALYAYQETSSTVVTFSSGLHVGAQVKFVTSAINASSYGDAEQITYNPPFTGGVTTNVEAKLAQTVSVNDFGAIGNGVADDTAAIQAALDYAATFIILNANIESQVSGGLTVHLPRGIYNISDTLVVAPGVSLIGDGKMSTVIQNLTTNKTLIRNSLGAVYNSLGSQIADLALYGSRTSVDQWGIDLLRWLNGVVRNVYAQNMGAGGYRLRQCICCTFDQVESHVSVGPGLSIGQGIISWNDTTLNGYPTNACVFNNCHMNRNDGAGILLNNFTNGCVFYGGAFENNYFSSGSNVGYNIEILSDTVMPNEFVDVWCEGPVQCHVYQNSTNVSSSNRFTRLHHFGNGVSGDVDRAVIIASGTMYLVDPTGHGGAYRLIAGSKTPFRVNKPNAVIYLQNPTGSTIVGMEPFVEDSAGNTTNLENYLYQYGYNSTRGATQRYSIQNGSVAWAEYYVDNEAEPRFRFEPLYNALAFGAGGSTAPDVMLKRTAVRTLGLDTRGGAQYIDAGSAWNGNHLLLGTYHLWVDATGDLRIKSSAPTSDTDGTVVGTQS